ncbi:ABC transporter permease (plasmid) [Streptomyces sp. BI20]|uniref:ABC transporter permease n=1 Tax=Streptomyces sp. BI20 TaxID=3403460 RepID=UPI003C70F08C
MSHPALPTLPVVHGEWLKTRSTRAVLATLLSIPVVTVGMTLISTLATADAEPGALGDDPLLAAFFGINFGQVAAVAFGATAVAGEFRDGALRLSLITVPHRVRFHLSKMLVIGGLALVVGEFTGLATFLAGQAAMGEAALSLGDPGAARAVVGAGVHLALLALLSAGLTTLLRSGALVLGLLIPVLLILPFVVGQVAGGLGRFMPDRAGQAVLRSVPGEALDPWTGLAVAALWSITALAAGLVALHRRDA